MASDRTLDAWDRTVAPKRFNGNGSDAAHHTPFPATAITAEELTNIAPRELVYGHFLYRKFISAIGAPGGAGKTAYAMAVALAVTTGRDLLEEGVFDAGNVWFYNLEDPRSELLRRLKAAMVAHAITYPDIASRLFLDSGRDRPLIIARAEPDGTVIASPEVEGLIEELIRRNIRLLIVDPVVQCHRVSENNNDQINAVASLWADVADRADCAILLLHHFRKGGAKGGAPGDAGSFRGASALIDASRAAVTISTMSEEESTTLGVHNANRWRHIRVDSAKLNLAPPPAEAVWMTLESVDLDNATETRPSDSVQTVRRWYSTSPFATTDMIAIVAALDRLQKGPEPGEQYCLTGGTAGRWAGLVLVAMLGKTDQDAKRILHAWKRDGLIRSVTYRSRVDRKNRSGMEVNQAKLDAMRSQIYQRSTVSGGVEDEDET